MGNTASNDSGKTPPKEKMRLSPANENSPHASLDHEMVRNSLLQRGLCIGESDLKDVLTKHGNLIEALTYVVESGLARRNVKAQHGPRPNHNKNRQENIRPLVPGQELADKKRATQKRAWHGGDFDGSQPLTRRRAERTLEPQPQAAIGSPFPEVLHRSGLLKPLESPEQEAVQGLGRMGGKADSIASGNTCAGKVKQPQSSVVLPVQPASPSKLHFGSSPDAFLKLPEKGLPPTNFAEKPAERTFATLPEHLHIGTFEDTMALGLNGWSEKTLEEKEQSMRAIKKDLRLPPLGPERQERLDKQLSRTIQAALNYLANSSSTQEGASVVGSAIRDTRETIHDTTVTVCGRYRELYQRPSHGFDTTWGGMADDDPFQALIDDGGLSSRFQCSPDSLFASHSPSRGSRSSNDTNGSLSLSTSGRALNSLGSFGQTEEARDRGPFFSRCQGSSLSPLSSASSATHFGAPDEMSASDVAAAARDQKVPEEDLFWTASSVCKEALRKTAFARKEGEWLSDQAKVVQRKNNEMQADSKRQELTQQQKVKKLNEELHIAGEKVESATKEVIGAHLGPQTSTEDALRSLLATLDKKRDRSAHKLDTRQKSIDLHASTTVAYKAEHTTCMLLKHAMEVTTILREELLGDLLDVIWAMQTQTKKRRVVCQKDLKSTASQVFEKLKAAIVFNLKRKHHADIILEDMNQKIVNESNLFGTGAKATIQSSQTKATEMQVFSHDSAQRMKKIKRQAAKLFSKLKADLPEVDVLPMIESAKLFFLSQASFSNAESVGVGVSSGRYRKASGFGGAEVEEGDDCSLM